MHTHHSHSGQFCQHARDTLEQVVNQAIENKFTLLCLTEHVPRLDHALLYPEELESGTTPQDLFKTFDEYYHTAIALKEKYQDKITIYVGFESEGVKGPTLENIQSFPQRYQFEMKVGSLHHVDNIPIDYDQRQWDEACQFAGGRDALFGRYFDQQYDIIKALRPTVVGHFDLIRLFSPDHSISAENWAKVVRNVELGVELGCLFEINTSAIRKGWETPYPQRDIADLIKSLGGSFCLSDDSHGTAQVGLNYPKVLDYLESYGPLRGVDGSALNTQQYKAWINSLNV